MQRSGHFVTWQFLQLSQRFSLAKNDDKQAEHLIPCALHLRVLSVPLAHIPTGDKA